MTKKDYVKIVSMIQESTDAVMTLPTIRQACLNGAGRTGLKTLILNKVATVFCLGLARDNPSFNPKMFREAVLDPLHKLPP